jgi:hypothetical protein
MLKSIIITAAVALSITLTGCKSESEKKADEGNTKIQQMDTINRDLYVKGVYVNLANHNASYDSQSISALYRMSDATLDETITKLETYSALANDVIAIIHSDNISYTGSEADLREASQRASRLAAEGRAIRAERRARGGVVRGQALPQCDSTSKSEVSWESPEMKVTSISGDIAKAKWEEFGRLANTEVSDPADPKKFGGILVFNAVERRNGKHTCWNYRPATRRDRVEAVAADCEVYQCNIVD